MPPHILDNSDFDKRLSALGPFERRPHLAVAVSGGSDSLSLVLLASRWVACRGGRVTALSVDHELRAESTKEIEQVSKWMRSKDIDHHILSWDGKKPIAGLQAAARIARYKLMTEWCCQASVLHLLVAHTRDDQAETYLLRLEKSSGDEGLAAMSEIRETSSIRLLRPFLGVPKRALRAFLESEGQDWIEDPSNNNRAFARIRIRQNIINGDFNSEALAQSAARFGRVRLELETSVYQLLASSSRIHPAGFVVLNPNEIFRAPEEVGLRVLGRVISTIGGKIFSPRMKKLARLYKDLSGIVSRDTGFLSTTLGGCRIIFGNGKYCKKVLICREARNLPKPMLVKASSELVWDSRFQIQFVSNIHPGSMIAALGDLEKFYQDLDLNLKDCNIPSPARLALPSLFDKKGIFCIPHLGFLRLDLSPSIRKIRFYPPNSISRVGFFLR